MDPNCSVRRDSQSLRDWSALPRHHQWIQIALYAETQKGSKKAPEGFVPSMDPNCSVRRDRKRRIPTAKQKRNTINGSKLLCTQRPCVRIALTWCRLWKV